MMVELYKMEHQKNYYSSLTHFLENWSFNTNKAKASNNKKPRENW
jgi:hypothetical protein